jgi:hypothetical protein
MHCKGSSHLDVPGVAFRIRKVKPAIIMIQTVLVLCGTEKNLRKTKRVLDEAERAETVPPMSLRHRSPVDLAFDGASFGSRVDRALDTGHRGIPRIVNFSSIELHLDYMSALQKTTFVRKRHVVDDRKRNGTHEVVVV